MRWLVVVITLVATSIASAGIIEDLAKDPEVLNAQLSPNGEYLAVLREEEDKRIVVVFTFPAMQLSSVMSFPGRNEVGWFAWVNEDRLIARVVENFDYLEGEQSRGELFAMNADGTKSEHLFGYRAGADAAKSRTQRKRNEYGSASILDYLWDDPKHVLVEIVYFNTGGYNFVVEAARLNVYNGRLSRRIRAPMSNANLVAANGDVRFSFTNDDDQNLVIHLRDPKSGEWSELSRTPYGESAITPYGVADDGRMYVGYEPNGGPRGVYLMDINSQERELISQHSVVNTSFLTDHQDKPYGGFTQDGTLDFVSFNDAHPLSAALQRVEPAFPGRQPWVSSATHNFDKVIFGVADDNSTTEFYLLDDGKLQLLFDSRPAVDDELLAERQPVSYEARDGITIHGYLSIPPGSSGKNQPFVIVPHGGPHGPRDDWSLGWEAFIPASGYTMLQVNYRGSGGYGTRFEAMGFRKWHTTMQDDLTDAVRWAIDEGIADPNRICIFGWSYGGYAAVMSIAREPDLYKCSIAGAGVYDNEEQYRNADFAVGTRWGKKYMDKVIGPTKEDRATASPITYVDRIKTPLLLIHGEEDARVPVAHSYKLIDAMVKAGKPKPPYIELENEPHGPRKEENVIIWYSSVIDFLERHIGRPELAAR